MPKVLSEARSMCPELLDAIKEIDHLAYTRQYGEVFSDLIDWLVWQHTFPPNEDNPLEKKYNENEQKSFLTIFKNIQTEIRQRVSLWTRDPDVSELNCQAWYDPLGRMYECITNKNKSSRMGQYFTPETVVNLMVQINDSGETNEVTRILDPACGSGRMGLAAATHALAQSVPTWVTMNDLDPICTKMTAVNMALHGLVGEVLCMNGLDIKGESYRFGYQVQPAIAEYPEGMWEFYRMLILTKTGQDIKKQYVLKSIPYEQTFLKEANDQVLLEYQKRQQIADEEKRRQALQELEETVKARMVGTLFEGDESLLKNATIFEKKSEHKKKQIKKLPPENKQRKLF